MTKLIDKVNCRNYNFCKNPNKHCAIIYSKSIDKPIDAKIKYSKCVLEKGLQSCDFYNCGIQVY